MAPGRQADAIAFAKKIASLYKQVTGVEVHVSTVMTGTLGVLCLSVDYESMAHREAIEAKIWANSDMQAMGQQYSQEFRDGTSPWVPGAEHEEIWRDA